MDRFRPSLDLRNSPVAAEVISDAAAGQRGLRGYAVSVALVAAASAFTWLLWQWIHPQIGPLFIAAVMLGAWYGGLGPGLLATALAGFITIFFFVDPVGSFSVDLADLLRQGVFVLVAVLISWINAARNRVQWQLFAAREQLERRVSERTAELSVANDSLRQQVEARRRAEQELLAHQARLRELASDLSLTEERQRRRIAARLHDDVGQLLSLSQMKLDSTSGPCPECGRGMGEVRRLVEEAIARTRVITCELSPPALYELGLAPAIAWLVEQMRRQSGLPITVSVDGCLPPLDEPLRVLLFQCVRELLGNVLKHARAASAHLRVWHDEPELRITVVDDGVGFDPDQPRSAHGNCFGLFNAREQLRRHGGQLLVESAPGSGSRFTVRLPLPAPSQNPEEDLQ